MTIVGSKHEGIEAVSIPHCQRRAVAKQQLCTRAVPILHHARGLAKICGSTHRHDAREELLTTAGDRDPHESGESCGVLGVHFCPVAKQCVGKRLLAIGSCHHESGASILLREVHVDAPFQERFDLPRFATRHSVVQLRGMSASNHREPRKPRYHGVSTPTSARQHATQAHHKVI